MDSSKAESGSFGIVLETWETEGKWQETAKGWEVFLRGKKKMLFPLARDFIGLW